ncbi:MAG: hypothetical protein JJ850_05905 [Kordiimonadaceae bacterium]|nr:hypothetical protein [Kordiimonadaceae bacterium]MBO6568142.1 hypothetical protein [Kordiimonadaceae bacterium]MBO6964128.1 hypothetical protein [Kordiimonadaceae bacterium]
MADTKTDQVQDSDVQPEPEVQVVDAEIVEETEAPKRASAEPKTVKSVPPVAEKGGRAGWVAFGFLATFVGGLFAAPYASESLRDLGLLPPLAPTEQPQAGADFSAAIEAMQARSADIAVTLERQQEILSQHETALADATTARTQLQTDIALAAGSNVQAADGSASANLNAVEARITALTDEVARLATLSAEENPQVAGLNGAVALARAEAAQLREKLQALESIVSELQAGSLEVSPRGRMLLALSRLKDQASSGLSIAADLDVLRADMATLPALDQQLIGADVAVLTNHPDGVRTFEALVRDFGGAASAAKRAQEKSDGSVLASLFTVRRTDDGADGIDAMLLDAERRLLARDVSGALEALSVLTGDALEATSVWREAATSYVAVTTALDRLQRAIAQSSPQTGGGRR